MKPANTLPKSVGEADKRAAANSQKRRRVRWCALELPSVRPCALTLRISDPPPKIYEYN